LPFAVGIPILPVFGWLGAVGSLPPAFAFLVPVAIAAGAALAIANALADVDRDRAAGVASIATSVGPLRAWTIEAVLVAVIVGAAVGSALVLRAPSNGIIAVAAASWLPLVGLGLGRGRGADLRERGWQLAAVGMAAVGVAWIWAIRG
jgi:4-hydroxybenzoate polyprenyltransferase